MMHYWQEVFKVMGITGRNPSSRINDSQIPLEPLANSDIPLAVIVDFFFLKTSLAFILSQPQ